MKNPFLNSNDIFQKIDDKKPSTAFHSKNPDPSPYPSYQPYTHSDTKSQRFNNQNRNDKVFSPLVGANYSNKTYTDVSPLNQVEWGINRNDYSKREQGFKHGTDYEFLSTKNGYKPEVKADYKSNFAKDYTTDYKTNYQNQYQPKQTYQPLSEYKPHETTEYSFPKYTPPEQQAYAKPYEYQNTSHSSYQPLPQKQSHSNSMYTSPHNTTLPFKYNGDFDNMDMKNSYEISKMDKELTRFLSSHQNIAEITKIFGLGNITEECSDKSYYKNPQQPQPQPQTKLHPITTHTPTPAPAPKMKQTFKESLTFQPFLIVGEQDQNFNQQQENNSQKFNCSFMSLGNKNKGPLFRVNEVCGRGLEFQLKRNLEEEIGLRCCRGNMRVLLTGEEKIRVKRYQL